MEKRRILVVDDEEDLCEILRFNLVNAGFDVDTAFSAEEAYLRLKNNYNLILLDVMMGAISGFKLAQLIREDFGGEVPIIFISAKDQESDKLRGFGLGADDYISKPFSIKEVIARVNAVLQRTQINKGAISRMTDDGDEIMDFGKLTINRIQKVVMIEDRVVKLTKKEFEILCMLAGDPHRIFSRSEILDTVWRDEAYVIERTVDVHIARLRKKIEPYGSSIVNRSGYGYCFLKE